MVVILASNFTPYDEMRGKNAGVAGHVLKPFDTQTLIDKVRCITNIFTGRTGALLALHAC